MLPQSSLRSGRAALPISCPCAFLSAGRGDFAGSRQSGTSGRSLGCACGGAREGAALHRTGGCVPSRFRSVPPSTRAAVLGRAAAAVAMPASDPLRARRPRRSFPMGMPAAGVETDALAAGLGAEGTLHGLQRVASVGRFPRREATTAAARAGSAASPGRSCERLRTRPASRRPRLQRLLRRRPVHRHARARLRQPPGERLARELAALVRVEDLRARVRLQGLLQRLGAETAVERVRQPPRQHAATRPVHHRH